MTRSQLLPAAVLAFLVVACGPLETDEELAAQDAEFAAALQARTDGGSSGAGALTLSTAAVTAGAAITGTVRASEGAVVYLTYSKTLFAGPGWVRIPSGKRSATFTLASNPFVAAATATTISARTSTPDPASFTSLAVAVLPASTPPATARPQVASAVLSPSTVTSGTTSTCTLTLSAPAPSMGAAVMVSISNDFFGLDADVPAVVVVPAGATSATFPVRTHLSRAISSSATEYVVASYFGGTFGGAALLVNAN
ncbi:MAG: hypothetical protein IPO09_22110 [Anaeromyxobacter sp.]|nr:hypothetical protein [Anaeromyxobacter sp.]MBL0274541.1 hypothetical protein [Anaeromyxobacter sp.]